MPMLQESPCCIHPLRCTGCKSRSNLQQEGYPCSTCRSSSLRQNPRESIDPRRPLPMLQHDLHRSFATVRACCLGQPSLVKLQREVAPCAQQRLHQHLGPHLSWAAYLDLLPQPAQGSSPDLQKCPTSLERWRSPAEVPRFTQSVHASLVLSFSKTAVPMALTASSVTCVTQGSASAARRNDGS